MGAKLTLFNVKPSVVEGFWSVGLQRLKNNIN